MTSRGPLAGLLALLCLLPARPAAADDGKLSPMLRKARTHGPGVLGLSPAMGLASGSAPADPLLNVKLRLRPGAARDSVAARHPGVALRVQNGRIATASLRFSRLAELAADPDVEYLEESRRLLPLLNVSRSTAVRAGLFLGGVTGPNADFGADLGQGVVVGFVDSGIDWRHRDFRDSGDASRVLYIWDQTDNGASPGPPAGFGYGTEWTKAHLDDDLGPNVDGLAVRTQDTEGHGTHVAGVAAGDGSSTDGGEPAGTYKGFAPQADLVVVKTTLEDTDVIDGVNYIVARAAALGKRAVINISLGNHFGSHDGRSVFSAALDAVAADTPVVAAAGNEGNDAVHAGFDVGTGPGNFWTVSVATIGTTAERFFLDFWVPAGNSYTVTVTTSPVGGNQVVAAPGQTTLDGFGSTFIDVFNSTHSDHPLGDREILIHVFQSVPGTPLARGTFFVKFARNSGTTQRVNGWALGGAEFASDVDPFDDGHRHGLGEQRDRRGLLLQQAALGRRRRQRLLGHLLLPRRRVPGQALVLQQQGADPRRPGQARARRPRRHGRLGHVHPRGPAPARRALRHPGRSPHPERRDQHGRAGGGRHGGPQA